LQVIKSSKRQENDFDKKHRKRKFKDTEGWTEALKLMLRKYNDEDYLNFLELPFDQWTEGHWKVMKCAARNYYEVARKLRVQKRKHYQPEPVPSKLDLIFEQNKLLADQIKLLTEQNAKLMQKLEERETVHIPFGEPVHTPSLPSTPLQANPATSPETPADVNELLHNINKQQLAQVMAFRKKRRVYQPCK
jgi:hypothetical protein